MIALNDIVRAYPNQNVLVIAHGAVINYILASVSNLRVGRRITTLKIRSLSLLNRSEPIWLIESVSQAHHFRMTYLLVIYLPEWYCVICSFFTFRFFHMMFIS